MPKLVNSRRSIRHRVTGNEPESWTQLTAHGINPLPNWVVEQVRISLRGLGFLLVHAHRHVHDAHHRHVHSPEDQPGEPHSHRHEPLTHSHRHWPDLHHRRRHPHPHKEKAGA